ncbi:MAG: c-type cytochrome domain-containing protein [Planctomycetota bacterium]
MRRTLASLSVALLTAGLATAQDDAAERKPRIDFEAQVRPILRDHCVKCHGPDKQKGDLRLDLRRFVFSGEDDPIVPGDPDGSVLLDLVTLPADDPDVMPAEGEPLRPAQVEILRTWIAEGAEWPEAGDLQIEEREARRKAKEVIVLPPLDEAAAAAEAQSLDALKKRGAIAQRVAANTIAVDVNLSLLGDAVDDTVFADLTGLAPTLVWLNLARTKVSDEGLAAVAKFPRLRRLNLANTSVGDAGLAHLRGLRELEYLNLYGTKVSDEGITALAELKSLEKLFLWQSAVSDEGAKKLSAALPSTRIDLGREAETMIAEAAKAKAEAEAAAKAKADAEAAAKAEAEAKAKADGAAIANTQCPVSGKAIDAAVFSDFEGQRIAFCCTNCKAKFDADPTAFRGKLPAKK